MVILIAVLIFYVYVGLIHRSGQKAAFPYKRKVQKSLFRGAGDTGSS